MFARVSTVAVALALPLLAAAAAAPCSTGPVQCCNSMESTSSAAGSALLGVLGIAVQDVTGAIGLGCSPLSVVGAGGSTCKTEAVCCQNNNVGGAVSIGCAPISL